MKSTIKLALLVALLETGCVMLDTEIPHVCVQEQDIEIDVPLDLLSPENLESLGITTQSSVVGQATAGLAGDALSDMPVISLQESFTPDGLDSIPDTLEDIGAEASLRLVDIRIGGRADMFAGMQRLAVMLIPGPDGVDLTPVELAVCDVADGCDISTDEIAMVTDTTRDLLPLLESDSPELQVELVAQPSVSTYNLDVDVCMGASASLALSP